MIPVDYSTTSPLLSVYSLKRQGCPVHYWIGGRVDRPLVVLMHGATMDNRMFNPQVEALLPEYRVLVWDARGHRESQPIGASFSLACARRTCWRFWMKRVWIRLSSVACAYSKWEVWALKASRPMMRH
jgi:pimeloyl-ACP methyl ester carboxylesterase